MTRADSVYQPKLEELKVSVIIIVSCCAGGVSTGDIYGGHLENSYY